jgi:hypothetical protein
VSTISGPGSWRRRGRGDDGVAVVEFALIMPILLVLMLGMFTGAMAWNQSQALGQGARIAARTGSTMPRPIPEAAQTQLQVDEAWLDGLIDRAVAASEGEMAATVSGRVVCVAYVDPAGTDPDLTVSRTLTGAGTRISGTTPCFADGQGDTAQRIQVVMERAGRIDTGFYRIPMTIRRTAVYRYEADNGL